MNYLQEWEGFCFGEWTDKIDVRNFIQLNYTLYEGNEEFLQGTTERTNLIWKKVLELMNQERLKDGVLDIDTSSPSGINTFKSGYIDRDNEIIVGLQTDKPFKRAIFPNGGIRMVKESCNQYGYKLDPMIEEIYPKYRKTHNDCVFELYTKDIKACRKSGVITGLPDAYGRGRIIGDYRRVALYGINYLIEHKKKELSETENFDFSEELLRIREELSEQIHVLYEMKEMAKQYGYDISCPASNSKEAVQWLYFGYLSAIKDQNGAAMSLGRVSTFLDIYFERDLNKGIICEKELQEIMDDFVIKLRMVRFLRTHDYNQLFSGDPVWITESVGGIGLDGRPLVTKNSFRILHSLTNLGSAPEPNLTILWSDKLPNNFKKFCAKISIDSSSIQYENDDLIREYHGDDYGIACCVSPMQIGKEMQYFGARANLAKALLYAINGGIDEVSGVKIADGFEPILDEYLNYEKVMDKYDKMVDWLAKTYIKALNIIHYSHDKYCYEKAEMALCDRDIKRNMACGFAGLSVVADSLSAIKYSKVKVIRNENNIAIDFEIEGKYPQYGNADDRVDNIAKYLVEHFMSKLNKYKTYRNSIATQSILTITSNVVYGKKTGSTPDGRKYKEPFAPGANPLHGREKNGLLASLVSISQLPFECARDGISYTFSIVPKSLGKSEDIRINNLVSILDTFFLQKGYHINVNVLTRETLLDAMENPEKYPQLTVRVSGYAVNFIKLTKEQQQEVISRTFH